MSLMDVFSAKDPAVTTTTTVAAPSTTTMVQPRPLRLKPDTSFPWRRLAISMMGIVVIVFMWRWSVFHLYTLPQTSVAIFGSITNNAMYVIGFLVAYFVTGQAYFTNWSNVSASSVVTEVKSYLETKKTDKPAKKDK